MQSYHTSLGAGIDSLTLREHQVPQPGPGQVVVRVKACSLNNRELLITKLGYYPLPIKSDLVPVSDGAGEIAAIGEGVTKFAVGDRVMGAVFPHWMDGPFSQEVATQIGGSLDGMLTEYALLSEDGTIHIPKHLSFEEAATLPCAGVTAWNALTGGQGLQAGQTVLTLGSGNISLFAIQFAKLFGAQVIATTSSDERAARLRALGADAVINYRESPEWHEAVRRLTRGRGVDHVIEVGGSGTIVQSIKSTKYSGEVALTGNLARDPAADSGVQRAVFLGIVNLRGISLGHHAHFEAMNRAVTVNRLRPVIDRVFTFEQAKDAFRYYDEKHPFGKVIISIN
jgi:NADPH:quinone reductase-like Zn-dependent oxidoreductase